MKYKAIYDAVGKSDCTNIDDRSYWRLTKMDTVQKCYPLLIVMDNPRANLRLRISHESGEYSIVTGKLDLWSDAQKYCRSLRRYKYPSLQDAADGFENILEGAA